MVPNSYDNFFLAVAGAALIGLLFVAVSINPERTFGPGAPQERQGVAINAFTALIGAFFVSIVALLPVINIGSISIIMAALGFINSVRLGFQLVRSQMATRQSSQPLWLCLARMAFPILGSMVIYGLMINSGIRLLHQPTDVGDLANIAILIVFCYGVGLFRAWELLGAPRQSIITGWLDPLHDPNEKDLHPIID